MVNGMNIEIMELNEELIESYHVKRFIFKMIKENYNLEYVPEYHYDVKNLYEYYIKPLKNTFYISIDKDEDKLIGTSGIRSYDKNYKINNRFYNKDSTASLYRLFVEEEYRHKRIASKMLDKIEQFCKSVGYNEIYLHTQKDSYGALPFWLSKEYKIVENTFNKLGTIHMEKVL